MLLQCAISKHSTSASEYSLTTHPTPVGHFGGGQYVNYYWQTLHTYAIHSVLSQKRKSVIEKFLVKIYLFEQDIYSIQYLLTIRQLVVVNE